MNTSFHFGVSCGLLVIAWMLVPWSAHMLPGLPFSNDGSSTVVYLDRFLTEAVPMMIAVALVLAFTNLLYSVFRLRWKRAVQSVLELAIACAAALLLPTQ